MRYTSWMQHYSVTFKMRYGKSEFYSLRFHSIGDIYYNGKLLSEEVDSGGHRHLLSEQDIQLGTGCNRLHGNITHRDSPQRSDTFYSGLLSDPTTGISGTPSDLEDRVRAFGSNKKEVREPPGFCALFWGALEDFTMRILIVASFVSIGI